MVILALIRAVLGLAVAGGTVRTVMGTVFAQMQAGLPVDTISIPAYLVAIGLVATAIGAWQTYRGQQVLNAYYVAAGPAPAPRAMALEWIFLVIFILTFVNSNSSYLR
jgi:hypothetical protein